MFVSVYHELVVGDCSDEYYVHEYNSDMACNSDIYHFEGYHWVSVNETNPEVIEFALNHHFIPGETEAGCSATKAAVKGAIDATTKDLINCYLRGT